MSTESILSPIPYQTAKNMADEYGKYKNNGTLPTPSDGLTKWVYFSKFEIERLLYLLAREYPTQNDQEKGIKFYFGVYTEEENNRPSEPGVDYKDRLSLVMVPAIQGKDIIKDHGIENLPEKFVGTSTHSSTGGATYDNVGSNCPPKCNAAGDSL